ncbi:glycosyltransferase [Pedobacter frigidisoli]|uniref:Glycosyltransferase n=1 Tax=Pedobacter frigidisoli TaxID=2530455 RepID=A0A4R0P9F5_9SPHI|nr:glycosyltransferase [Pedobacter frigidisoli]TCD12752.1 glycosyltransferase [Pedobacter frigidisoli]
MKNTNHPLVSIALCTYNGQTYLKQQLDSLVNQTYQNIEIIIVDDQSSDLTAELCKSYQTDNIQFYINETNLGYTKNFEKAITLCNGDYICLCDQDDIWEMNKIEILVNEIGNCVLIYHDSNFINEVGQKIGAESMSTRYNMYEGKSALPFILSNCISGHAAMFSKALIPYLLPLDKRFYHDWWLAYIAFNIGEVKFLHQILVHYRQHENSITDNLNIKVKKTENEPANRIAIDINWVEKCSTFIANREPNLIKKAYYLFNNIQSGNSRTQLFLFLVKYYDLIFYIISNKKSFTSKINYARKIAFSKKPPF